MISMSIATAVCLLHQKVQQKFIHLALSGQVAPIFLLTTIHSMLQLYSIVITVAYEYLLSIACQEWSRTKNKGTISTKNTTCACVQMNEMFDQFVEVIHRFSN